MGLPLLPLLPRDPAQAVEMLARHIRQLQALLETSILGGASQVFEEGALGVNMASLGRVTLPTEIDAPATPTSLTVTPFLTQFGLSWDLTTDPTLVGYIIERAEDTGFTVGVTKVAQVAALSFVDGEFANGVTRYYRIRAIRKNGLESGSTPVVGATTISDPTSQLKNIETFGKVIQQAHSLPWP